MAPRWHAAQGAATIDGQLLAENSADQLLSSLSAAIPAAERIQVNPSSADPALHAVDPSVSPDSQNRQLEQDVSDAEQAVAGIGECQSLLDHRLGVDRPVEHDHEEA